LFSILHETTEKKVKNKSSLIHSIIFSFRLPSLTQVENVVPSLRYPGSQTHLLKPGRCSSGKQCALYPQSPSDEQK